MRFLRRPRAASRCIAVFSGAFHPPTVAHMALAQVARERVDEILWVMPERFPHKAYEGVSLPARLRLLLEATADAVAVASENLFFPIAAEASASIPGAEIRLLIGEDGARRVVEWNYGLEPESHQRFLAQQLERYPVLTAKRQGDWVVPAGLEGWFDWLEVDEQVASVSSTLVRDRMAAGQSWRDLVPEKVRDRVAELYASGGIVRGQ